MTLLTPRHKLPLLAVGQAQKEMIHNEAVMLIDNIMNIEVIGVSNDPSVALQNMSQHNMCWLIGSEPVGEWINKNNNIAIFSDNGWRYLEPVENMVLYNEELNSKMMFSESIWLPAIQISEASGGEFVDSQARDSIQEIIAAMKLFGLSR